MSFRRQISHFVISNPQQDIDKIPPRNSLASVSSSPLPLPSRVVQTSPIELNEILERIFSYLDRLTLTTVVPGVNHQWYRVAKSLFQRHLHLDPYNAETWVDYEHRIFFADKVTIGHASHRCEEDRRNKTVATGFDTILPRLYRLLAGSAPRYRYRGSRPYREEQEKEVEEDPAVAAASRERIAQLKIKVLTLDIDQWYCPQSRLWTLFNPKTLTEVSIDLPYNDRAFRLGILLNVAPNLQSVSISALKRRPYRDSGMRQSNGWLCPDEGPTPLSINADEVEDDGLNLEHFLYNSLPGPPHPLRYLTINNVNLSPTVLTSYLPRLQNLIELCLLQVQESTLRIDSRRQLGTFLDRDLKKQFWETLADSCPSLKIVQFEWGGNNRDTSTEIPLSRFPTVESWRISHLDKEMVPFLVQLRVHAVENRLTTLDFTSSCRSSYFSTSPPLNSQTDRALFRLLCASPVLLHLKAGPWLLSSEVLWNESERREIWACRGLRTLQLRLQGDLRFRNGTTVVEGRHVFAYLTRCCPRLEDLNLHFDMDGFALQDGLCLLSRLELLERLTLTRSRVPNPGDWNNVTSLQMPDQDNNIPLDWVDFAWLQMPREKPSVVWSLISSFVSRSSRVSSMTVFGEEGLVEDYEQSIKRVRQWSIDHPEPASQERERIQRHQRENGYLIDYERLNPMVDGIEDENFQLCGSYLEIECFLQARLFRLQQQLQQQQQLQLRNNTVGGGGGGKIDILRQYSPPNSMMPLVGGLTQPWSRMKLLKCSLEFNNDRRRVSQATKLLKEMRPELELTTIY